VIGLSRLKKFIVAGTLAVVGMASAFASPAQDLFEQASFYLESQYFGPYTGDIKALIDKYQLQVDKACADAKDTCAYEKIDPVLEEMFAELNDPHAGYQTSADVADERNQQSAGQSPTPRIGVTHRGFPDKDGKLLSYDRMIVNVLPGSPAEKAGLRYGDRWTGFGGTLFSSFKDDKAYTDFLATFGQQIRAGQTVTMSIVRGVERQKLDIGLKGELISLQELPTMTINPNGVAVIRLTTFFQQGVGNRVHALVREAQSKNAKAIIIDMRGNGGGSSSERLIALGAFIKDPEAQRRVPRYNADTRTYEELYKDGRWIVRDLKGNELGSEAAQNPTLWTGPVAVLVDSGCASACEYFASAFQRVKRGPILGEVTVGVGNTNRGSFGLINGGAALMPTLRATWPDGTLFPAQITPDVLIENYAFTLFDTGRDTVIEKALETLKVS
jgi:carboxyl-terminal processing protease